MFLQIITPYAANRESYKDENENEKYYDSWTHPATGEIFEKNDAVYSSYGVFVDHNAVCQGYAFAMNVLLDRAGVGCCYVVGNDGSHAWNMVCLDGSWYQLDATWARVGGDAYGRVTHKYFLKSDNEFDGHNNWSTEYGYVCENSFALPSALEAEHDDPVFQDLIRGRLLHAVGNTLYAFTPGSDFTAQTGLAEVSAEIIFAAYDPSLMEYYYQDNYGYLYFLDLNISNVTPVKLDKFSIYYGLLLQDSSVLPGAKVLSLVKDFQAIPHTLAGVVRSDLTRPAVLVRPKSTDADYVMLELDEQMDPATVSLLLVVYNENGEMRTARLLKRDANGVAALGSLPGRSAIVKLFVLDNGLVPLSFTELIVT